VPDLVSRVGSGIRRGFTVARVKSKEAVDVQRVKSQIRKLERERNAALQELGRRVCEMSDKGSFDEEDIRARCAAIAELASRMGGLEEEVQQVHVKAQESLHSSKTE